MEVYVKIARIIGKKYEIFEEKQIKILVDH